MLFQWLLYSCSCWKIHQLPKCTQVRMQVDCRSSQWPNHNRSWKDPSRQGSQVLAWCLVQRWRCCCQLFRMVEEHGSRQARQNAKKMVRKDQRELTRSHSRSNRNQPRSSRQETLDLRCQIKRYYLRRFGRGHEFSHNWSHWNCPRKEVGLENGRICQRYQKNSRILHLSRH